VYFLQFSHDISVACIVKEHVVFAACVGQLNMYFLQFSHDIGIASVVKEHVFKDIILT